MGHIQDLWTRPTGDVDSRRRAIREPSARHCIARRWLAIWHDGGVRRTKSFGNKDAAVRWLAEVDVDQRAGTYVSPHKLTLGEYGEKWIVAQIHQRASSLEQMESRWRLHIRPELGGLVLTDITRAKVQAAVVAWTDKLAATTVHVTYSYLTSMMTTALRDHLIRESPCVGINLPKISTERVVPLTVDQVHVIAGRIHHRYRAMVLLGAATGLRSAELRGLTLDRLAWGGTTVPILPTLRVRIDRQLITTAPRWGPPKTQKSDRAITVDGESAAVLREHLASWPTHISGLVFTGMKGGPMSRTSAATAWHAATAGMGLKDRTGWHDLRHFHASMLIAAGLSVTAVADRLGHQDSRETLKTYAHLWPSDEARAVLAIRDGLWGAQQTQSKRLDIAAGQGYVG